MGLHRARPPEHKTTTAPAATGAEDETKGMLRMSKQDVSKFNRRVFTREELEELGLPDDKDHTVFTELHDQRRWYNIWELVFRTDEDDRLWQVFYYEPATEIQGHDTWNDASEIEATQVEAYPVEVIHYRPVVAQ